MPYKSEAQRRFFNSPVGKEKIGKKEVEHWNKVSKGKELPEKVEDTLGKAITTCDVVDKTIVSNAISGMRNDLKALQTKVNSCKSVSEVNRIYDCLMKAFDWILKAK